MNTKQNATANLKAAVANKKADEAAIDAGRRSDITALIPEAKRPRPSQIEVTGAAAEVKARYLTRLEFCAAMRIGETRYHTYTNAGLIRPIRVGKTVLIPISECDALIERLAATAA